MNAILWVGPYRPVDMQDIVIVAAECIVGRLVLNICNSLERKGMFPMEKCLD